MLKSVLTVGELDYDWVKIMIQWFRIGGHGTTGLWRQEVQKV